MINIEELTVDDIGKILVLGKSGDQFNCLLPSHRNSKNSALEINSDGSFKCSCGLVGSGFVELASNLYGIDKSKAEEWLQSRLNGETIGEQST